MIPLIPILVFVDREPVSGQIFSEKRSKLLKIAGKTVSMGSAELFQRRSEFVGDILERLGSRNIIRKQEGSMRHSKIDCREAPAITKGQFDKLLDYRRSDFTSPTKLRRTGKSSPSNASDDACEFMALPWVHNQDHLSFIDWKNHLLVEIAQHVSAWHCHGCVSMIFRVLVGREALFATRLQTYY